MGTTTPFNSRPGSFTISNEAPTIYMEDTNGSGDKVGQILYQNAELSYSTGSRNGTGTSSSTEHFRITSAGRVGIGTTSPGVTLDVNSSTQTTLLKLTSTAGTSSAITFANTGSNDSIAISAESDDLKLRTDDGNILFALAENSEKMRLNINGNLGLGTTIPSATSGSSYKQFFVNTGGALVDSGGSGPATMLLNNSYIGSGNNNYATVTQKASRITMTSGRIDFATVGSVSADAQQTFTERMRITDGGNVGIGDSAPIAKLQVTTANSGVSPHALADELFIENSGDVGITLGSSTSGTGNIMFGDSGDPNRGRIRYHQSTDKMEFGTAGGNDKMVITSAGDLLVGTTSTNPGIGNANTGFSVTKAGGQVGNIAISQNGNYSANFNRNTSDGTIVQFSKQGTAVGVIGTQNWGIGTASPSAQLHIVGDDATDQVIIENTESGSASAPDLVLFRNSASPADNDVLGRIDFRGDNSAGSAVDYMIMYATASDITNGTEDVRLIFEGKKAGSNTKLLTIGEDEVIVNDDSADVDFRVESNNISNMFLVDGGTDKIFINTSSTISGSSAYLQIKNTYTRTGMSLESNNTAAHHSITFHNPNGQVGSINTSGSSTVYNTSSDYRLKENVNYDFDATTRLKQLRPARFNFIADADTTVDGFIAHEVSSVVPEAISGEKDAVDEDGTPEYQGIDQSKLVPLLVKTIQELEARITTLENA